MRLIIVSNNPLALSRWEDRFPVWYIDDSAMAVLLAARDLCHCGHRLLSHPLSGSVKPNETPYKSILLAPISSGTDPVSVLLLENAIATTAKFGAVRRNWREQELRDFQLVDMSLLESAMDSAENDLGNI